VSADDDDATATVDIKGSFNEQGHDDGKHARATAATASQYSSHYTGNALTGGVSKRPPNVTTPGSTRPTHKDKRVRIVLSVPAPACGVSASPGAELITATSTDTPQNQHTVEVVAAAMHAHSSNAEVQGKACHVDTGRWSKF